MKKAFVNQWYIVRINFFMLLGFAVLHVLQLVFDFFAFTSDFALVGVLFAGLFVGGYAQNAKWKTYSKTMPISVFERVIASFAFAVGQMLIALAAILTTNLVSLYVLNDVGAINLVWSLVDVEALPKEMLAASVAVAWFAGLSILTAFGFFITGALKRYFAIVGSLAVVWAMFGALTLIMLRLDGFLTVFANVMNKAPWQLAFVVIACVLLLLASWFAVLGIETVNSPESKKRFTTRALVVFAVAVLTFGGLVGYSYAKGYLVIPEREDKYSNYPHYNDYNDKTPETTTQPNNEENEKKIMDDVYGFLSEGMCVDLTMKDFEKRAQRIGFEKEGNEYISESKNIKFRVEGDSTVTEFNMVNDSTINTLVVHGNDEREAFIQKLNNGMSEEDLLELFKEEGVYPAYITEYYDFADGYDDRVIVRKYNIYLQTRSFASNLLASENELSTQYHTLTIHIADGKIVFVKMY